MDIKAKIEEYLEEDDLLYIDIFLVNGVSFNLFKPKEGTTLNIETDVGYLKIYGNVDDYSRMDACVPYEHITHIAATFGEQPAATETGNEEESE